MHESAPSVSLLLPTRNRPDTLAHTLNAIGALALPAAESCEVIVVDNASDDLPVLPKALTNGISVQLIRLHDNEGAAARNHAAQAARSPWLLMLDDDSYPLDAQFLEVIANAPRDVAAIGAEITLASGKRESGGLPEVIIGCGALIRRDAFLAVGGYDASFQYYAEEYDLCAKLIRAGKRITLDRRFHVMHGKVTAGRDMNAILHRLVRNNGWTLARYCPDDVRQRALDGTINRYREIAQRENAMHGFEAGLAELNATIEAQPRLSMTQVQYDRFTGLAYSRAALPSHPALAKPARVAIVDPGKHAWVVRQALSEIPTVTLIDHECDADVLVIGTLSPGPMLDAFDRRKSGDKRVLLPWQIDVVPRTKRNEPRAVAGVR